MTPTTCTAWSWRYARRRDNTRLLISKIEFYGETSGDVEVTFRDLRDGTLATETVTAVAGQIATLDVDIAIALRQGA